MAFVEEKRMKDEVEELAAKIYSSWDRGNDGVVFSDDIMDSCGVEDAEFGLALARILGNDNSGRIYKENLVEVLRVLKFGNLASKVGLFVKFMIRDSSGDISYETIRSHLKGSSNKILTRLGFINGDGQHVKDSLQYEDVLMLFKNFSSEERGLDAINIFCKQILRILTKNAKRKKTLSLFLPPASLVRCSLRDIQSFFSVLSRPRIYQIFLVFLQIGLWLFNFHWYRSRGFPLSFAMAKGFGINLRFLTIILYFSMARSSLGVLNNIGILKPFIFIGFNIEIHSFCGIFTLIHSIGHVVMHVIYQMSFRKNGFAQSFKQQSALRLIFNGKISSFDSTVLSGDAITGVILLGMIFLLAATAMMRGKDSKWYSLFTLSHYLYTLWIVFVILHVPILWPYFAAIAILFLIDRSYDFFLQTTHSNLSYSRPCNNGVTFLSVPFSKSSAGYPGCYYRIKVPTISSIEWHPFSFAGSNASHHLNFFVASSGDWTRHLYELVSDPAQRSKATVLVQGPFFAPSKDALKSPTESILLVASGIGITPFFSVIATKVTDEYVHESDRELYDSLFGEEDGLADRGGSSNTFDSLLHLDRSLLPYSNPNESSSDVKVLRLVWTLRDALELMFYMDYVYHLVKNQINLRKAVVHVDVYLTGLGKRTDPEYMVAQTLFLLSVSGKLSEHMVIHFGRPNMRRIVVTTKPDQIYYCGGDNLKESIGKICNDLNIRFIPESFDNTDRMVLKRFMTYLFPPKAATAKQSFSHKKRYDSLSTGYSYSKKNSLF